MREPIVPTALEMELWNVFYNNAGYVKSNFLDIERDGAFEIFHGKSDECNVHCHAAHRTREEAEVSAGARHAYGTINCGAIA